MPNDQQPGQRVYLRGWGWDVFTNDDGPHIERVDDNCWPHGNPNFMDDETAEWLVLFLAADGDKDAIKALSECEWAVL